MRYELPEIRNTFEGFSRLIKLAVATQEAEFEQVEIDFHRTTWIDAHMCAPLGAILYRINSDFNEVKLTNLSSDVKKILCKNSFMSAYGVEKVRDTYGTTMEYRRFRSTDERSFAQYVEKHFVGKGMPTMTEALDRRFRSSILELFSNAAEHSDTAHGIFVCGQYYPNKNRLDFAITDLGVGIPQKVRRYLGTSLAADKAIRWATEDANTTRRGAIPGGLGLKLLKDFVSKNEGTIQIASGEGYWQFSGGKARLDRFAHSFPGTVVNVEINTADEKTYRLANEITAQNVF